MNAPRRAANPYQARDELRGLLLVAAVAAVPDQHPVVAVDAGPTGAGALSDGAARSLVSRIRVEIGDPADVDPEHRLAAVRRHLVAEGWSVVRSAGAGDTLELVAVRAGYTIAVQRHRAERRLVLTGETPPLPS